MCGLVGTYCKKGISIDQFKLMINSLIHRGPDNNNLYTDKLNNVYLGHTRLSILDITNNANQPITSQSGRYVLVFNGEIYNYLNLKTKLNKSFDIKWTGNGDTEVLINLIEKIGIHKTLDEIKGMFSFAVYDLKEKKLILARDSFGEKPMYFGNSNGRFYFASELKAIVADSNFEKKINQSAVKYLMTLNYIPSPLSIYQNIFKLKPGHYLEIDLNNYDFHKHDFYQKKFINDELTINKNVDSFDENKNTLKKYLFNSVEDKMGSDVEIGSFLSSGVDSSMITTIMSKISKKKIKTFSLGFEENYFDESSQAQKISQYLNTEHYNIKFNLQNTSDIVMNLSNVFCEPFSDSSQIPTLYLSKFTSKYVKTCFSGDGGDELFGGYNRYIHSELIYNMYNNKNSFRKYLLGLISSGKYNYFIRNLFKVNFLIPSSLKIHNIIQKSGNIFNSMSEKSDYKMYQSINSHWGFNEFINSNTEDDIQYEYWNNNLSYLDKIMFFDLKTYLPDDLLVKVDRSSMANGLEVRSPFLDDYIKKFAFSLPSKFKVNNKQGKIILRSLLKDMLPKSLILNQKKGFLFPLKSVLKNELKNWSDNLFQKDIINSSNLFNVDAIYGEWKKFKNNQIVNEYKLWDYLIFQDWYLKNF